MGEHLRKKFSAQEVIEVLDRYLAAEIGPNEALALLKIKRRRFFDVLKLYRENPKEFSLTYKRSTPARQLPKNIDQKIESALKKEKQLIDDKNNPVRRYNYSYVKTRLEKDGEIEVSLSSIIRRAKKKGFINRSRPEKNMTAKY